MNNWAISTFKRVNLKMFFKRWVPIKLFNAICAKSLSYLHSIIFITSIEDIRFLHCISIRYFNRFLVAFK